MELVSREPRTLAIAEIEAWPCAHALPTHAIAAEDSQERVAPSDLAALPSFSFANASAACTRRGSDAERAFLAAMEAQGWAPLRTTFADDYQRHVDFRLLKDGHVLQVDVKALRALRRNGALQNELMFVEMHDSGWLHGGQADVIAQQVCADPPRFILLDRAKLSAYARCAVYTHEPLVPWPEQCYLRLYRRAGKTRELISLLLLQDAVRAAGCQCIGT